MYEIEDIAFPFPVAQPGTKRCTRCKEIKPLIDFYKDNKSKDKFHCYCKPCCDIVHRANYLITKEQRIECMNKRIKSIYKFILDYLINHPCVDCGENDPVVLEFDHVRGKKTLNISQMAAARYSIKKITAEIEKCDIRCANCHRRKTYSDRNHKSKQIFIGD